MKRRILAIILALVMFLAFLVGCKKNGKEEKPNTTKEPVPDAQITTEFIAKVGDTEIYVSEFKYFLYDALREIDFDVLDLPDDSTEQEQYDIMLAFLKEKDENGISLLDTAVERAIELSCLFKVTYLIGVEKGFALDEEGIQEQYDSIDEFVDYYLSLYSEEMNISTRDEMMEVMYSMNVNDYKRLAIQQVCANNYAKSVIEAYEFTDQEIEDFYNEHEEDYRVVQVRHILIMTIDEEGEEYDEEIKAEKLAKAERVMNKILAGDDDIEALVKGYSEDNDLSNLGLYEVTKNSGFVKEFEEWALKQTEVTDIVEIIETTYGYHVMMCENIYGIEDETVKESVIAGMENDKFDKEIKDLLETDKYKLVERNDELIKKATDEYVTLMFETDEDDE